MTARPFAPVQGCDCYRCTAAHQGSAADAFPFGSAGAARAEQHTVTFTGPRGTWTTSCDSQLAAANEALTELQLGTAVAAHIEGVSR